MSAPDLLNITTPPEWMTDGLCAQVDPELWFPEQGASTREATTVCTHCTVRSECLAYALAHDERFGVWGGLSEHARRQLTARRPAADVDEWIREHADTGIKQ